MQNVSHANKPEFYPVLHSIFLKHKIIKVNVSDLEDLLRLELGDKSQEDKSFVLEIRKNGTELKLL